MHKAHAAPPVQGQIKAIRKPLSCASRAGLVGLPDALRPRWGTGGQAQRELSARRSDEGNYRASEAHQIAALNVRFCGRYWGVKRTWRFALHMSAFDPKRTLAVRCGNRFDAGFSPYRSARLNRYDAVS
jgi:hypothetical protein